MPLKESRYPQDGKLIVACNDDCIHRGREGLEG